MKKIILIAAALMLTAGMATIQAKGKANKGTAKPASTQVIYTGEIAKSVIGYNSTTPLNIYIENGKIVKIEALENKEGPNYMKRATAKVFSQYEGKTVNEAKKVNADVATGATYTSEALIKNIQMGLDQVKTEKNQAKTASKKKSSKNKKK